MLKAEDYVDLPYHLRIVRSSWDDGRAGWFAEVEELPGCMTQADTLAEVEQSIRDAIRGWVEAQLETDRPVPRPREDAEETHSGKFLTRMPRTLHARIAAEAESEGVSLNAFVVAALSAAVGWRQEAVAGPGHAPPRSTHVTPEMIASSLGWSREDVIRFAHTHAIPIYHGRIDRNLFQVVLEEPKTDPFTGSAPKPSQPA